MHRLEQSGVSVMSQMCDISRGRRFRTAPLIVKRDSYKDNEPWKADVGRFRAIESQICVADFRVFAGIRS